MLYVTFWLKEIYNVYFVFQKYPLFYNMTCKNITNWVLYYRQQVSIVLHKMCISCFKILILTLNPFPHTTNLQQTTLKAFRQTHRKVDILTEKSWKYCGKRRNCSFWKVVCCRVVRKHLYVGTLKNCLTEKKFYLKMKVILRGKDQFTPYRDLWVSHLF